MKRVAELLRLLADELAPEAPPVVPAAAPKRKRVRRGPPARPVREPSEIDRARARAELRRLGYSVGGT